MKKVLALVLAVIMVCTMAMAVTIGGIGYDVKDGAVTSNTYPVVPGGTKFFVNMSKAEDTVKNHIYFDKDGKFVPSKNEVSISYAAGSELVAFSGWVKLANVVDTDLSQGIVKETCEKNPASYQYQIALKNDFTRTADGKSFDFAISKITFTATGWEPVTLWKATDANAVDDKADVGYKVVGVNASATKGQIVSFNTTPGAINKVLSIAETTDGTTINSATLAIAGEFGYGYTSTYANIYAYATLNKGSLVYVSAVDGLKTFATGENGDEGYLGNNVAVIRNVYNMPMTGVLEQTEGAKATTVYNVYAKGMDGKISSVAATLKNGVLTFNVPALSTVIITPDTLTVTATVAGTTTETGTTTNPGTGANDVVGVAAALAVVALVSGAAISLKK
ncbi:MAG: hypothetical protein U0M59_09505 [Angelakisella sp.]|nr:hypothetical protein [Clostridiales bacterium]